jgi:hypothetical protein
MPDPQDGNDSSDVLPLGEPFECAAKVENCVVRWLCPQEGHNNPFEAPLRTSFSNFVPQSSHRYSKMGM